MTLHDSKPVVIIVNGEVYAPQNGIDGQVRDICVSGGKISDGKIVAEVEPGSDVIDASGMVVLPGGVEIHAHVAGPKVNAGRRMRPEDHRNLVIPRTAITRSGTGHTVPSTFVTGYHFAGFGYTTVMEAAGPPLEARHVHEELHDIPIVDKGFIVMMGNNHFVMKFIHEGDFSKLRDYVAWLLEASGGYAIKVVNPAGVDRWKWGKNVHSLDDPADTFPVSPRQFLISLARVQQELGIPHPIHVHCNNLGCPGNAEITRQTMETVSDLGIHITHLQFNGFGKTDKNDYRSGAAELAEFVNAHPKVTAVPWTVGLEFALLVNDPWRVYLTTDHPNGGPFHA